MASDEYDPAGWENLVNLNLKFNAILSDAMHADTAILEEWRKLKEGELLDLSDFVMFWDDLGDNNVDYPSMKLAWNQIFEDMKTIAKKELYKHDFCVNGWIGKNEVCHVIGIISTVNVAPLLQFQY